MKTRFGSYLKQSTILGSSILVGCTSVTVMPLDSSHKVQKVCIRENPKVTVSDFVTVVRNGLSRHEIDSEFIPFNPQNTTVPLEEPEESNYDRYYMYITKLPDTCDFSLAYTARRSWDIGTYLSVADIEVSDKTSLIASANYHLIRKGGFSLFKWQGVETKMAPVMDELLQQYPLTDFQNTQQQNTPPAIPLNSSQPLDVQEETNTESITKPSSSSWVEPKQESIEVIQDTVKSFPESTNEIAKPSVLDDVEAPGMKQCIENWHQSAWYSINQGTLNESTDIAKEQKRKELEKQIYQTCKNNMTFPLPKD
jgi:hypothetical protein